MLASAKNGIGIKEMLEAVVQRVPPPQGSIPMRRCGALIFDSWFDPYRGVIILTRVVDGTLAQGPEDPAVVQRQLFEVEGLGFQSPKPDPLRRTGGRRSRVSVRQYQDRFRRARSATRSWTTANPATEPLPGFQEIKPMVFAGLYPVESHEHGLLRDALEKLRLNDSAFNFEPENSAALGFRIPLRIPGSACIWRSCRSGWSASSRST